MATNKIGLLVGSLRKESYSRKIAQLLITLAPTNLQLEIIEIGGLGLYNPDLESSKPAEWETFRSQIRSSAGIIFVTPEYNRSVPGILKNAIDTGSRPPAENVWNGKPVAIISLSQGVMGGFGANHHLRQCLVFPNAFAMTQPEAYLAKVNTLFDDKGNFTNEDTRKFLLSFIKAFEIWISRFAS
jgi:chromate reductase, NAD(P)H dehydrogenase (quinone)